jgi:hypothetical protein
MYFSIFCFKDAVDNIGETDKKEHRDNDGKAQ